MDSFLAAANDLDRVLDEFEQNEESLAPGVQHANWKAIPSYLQGSGSQASTMSSPGKPDFNLAHPTPHTNGLSVEDVQRGGLTNGAVDGDQRSQSDAASSNSGSDLLIDLSEADFAPSAKPSSLLSALQESLAAEKEAEPSKQIASDENGESGSEVMYSDSNSQLDRQDFTTYMSSNSTRSMSIGDLDKIDSSPPTEQPVESQQQNLNLHLNEQNALKMDSNFDQSSVSSFSQMALSKGNSETSGIVSDTSVKSTPISFGDKSEQHDDYSGTTNGIEQNSMDELPNSRTLQYEDEKQSLEERDSLESSGIQKPVERMTTEVDSAEANKDNTLEKGSPSSYTSSSSTPPVDSETMQEYMRQGARPKQLGYKTPEQSPLKNTSDKDQAKEEPPSNVVRVTETPPVVGFSTLSNVTVSQSELDELEDLDSKPLAYDVSGSDVLRRDGTLPNLGPPQQDVPVLGMDDQSPYILTGQDHMVNKGRSNMESSVLPTAPGTIPLNSNGAPPSTATVPPKLSGPVSNTKTTLHNDSSAPQNLSITPHSNFLSIPDDQDNADDRISPLSKILDQQYRLDVNNSKGNDNELANVDPFYGGKPQFESSTEEEVVPAGLSNTFSPSMQTNQQLPDSTGGHPSGDPSPASSVHPAMSTLGFGITTESENNLNDSLLPKMVNGRHQVNPDTLMSNTTSHQIGQQDLAPGDKEHQRQRNTSHQSSPMNNHADFGHQVSANSRLQDLAPIQNFTVPAGAPPELSTAQPVPPSMSPEMGVEANLEESLHNLPPDPPSYQQVEQATHTERNVSRQGLTLDFGMGGSEQMNGYASEHADGMNEIDQSRNPHFVAPPNVSLTPGMVLPVDQSQNGTMPSPNGNMAGDPSVVENGEFAVSEGLDPMTAQNNALNAQHMLPVQASGDGEAVPGDVAPIWIPDSDAPSCMGCDLKFTFRKRRHHCRACGKVFCSRCCNVRVRLRYMDSKEARVCVACLNAILTAEALERVRRQGGNTSVENSPAGSPAHQAVAQTLEPAAASTPENAIQRGKSVLRRPVSDGSRLKERRSVHFSDGTTPGKDTSGHETESPPSTGGGVISIPTTGDSSAQNIPTSIRGIPELQGGNRRRLQRQGWHKSLIPEDESRLPPVILTTEVKGEFSVDDNPNTEKILNDLKSDNPVPAVFVLSKNLMVLAQIVDLNCCVNRTCWCFSTKGLSTVGQDEVVIVLECLPDEKTIPRDIFCHLYSLYEDAKRGNTVTDMSHTIFAGGGFLGSREHGGFLYIRPTFQCLQKLVLPDHPYLVAVLLQKWETPWAKVFPLRLLLRLGAEFRYYPCPLMSVRFRKPVFGEIGHTIMNLLADFKNYQYKLPVIRGVVIHMEDKQTVLKFPRNRYDELMKVLNNSNEHVMALAAVFSPEADSHLVCMQNEQGTYQTQAINIQNKPRKVTGASFVVFNGALKSSSGLTAKSSIVEDGLMVQIRPETMTLLKDSMRQMQEMSIPCGSSEADTPEETVLVQWVEDDKKFNSGVTSPIDGQSLTGVESVRIHNGTEYHGHNRAIRWTEVFFIQNGLGEGESLGHPNVPEPVDLSRLAESLASAFCLALSGSLNELREAGLVKLGLRVTVDIEKVGYESGSKGQLLPPHYMNSLDNELIPVVHGAVSQHEGAPVVLELIFHIID
ncbi:uncharacterized protein LOC575625 isoform X1 [Strongylocentrotus purpuratus]|uniref:FYVE-type domain-containing protein n=2 Tax=Strongylocentrotus purpuratus TaxID=7668 RepID=A0A7M7R9W8_STRPU|nr:uncharacterized protein LOC575625 isoform X1 [Strongylocentrotus purpuratus]|eukprot:XP_781105.3 PREDICTED: uncharacterized protein LOC575625 isoform X1 [Strongylocentrotus purpuratus]